MARILDKLTGLMRRPSSSHLEPIMGRMSKQAMQSPYPTLQASPIEASKARDWGSRLFPWVNPLQLIRSSTIGPSSASSSAAASGAAEAQSPFGDEAAATNEPSPNEEPDLELPPLPEANKLRQKLKLPNGQTICFDEYGRPDGVPLIYLHGYPSSGIEGFGLHTLGWRMGLRIICPDRPGFCQSSPWLADSQLTANSDLRPGFLPIREYPNQLAALAWHLDLADFAVIGVSGGGPYAVSSANSLQSAIDKFSEDDVRRLVHANLAYEEDIARTGGDAGTSFDPPLSNKEEMIMSRLPKNKPYVAAVGVIAGVGPYIVLGSKGMLWYARVANWLTSNSAFLSRLVAGWFVRFAQNDPTGDRMTAALRKQGEKLPTERERKLASDEQVLRTVTVLFRASMLGTDPYAVWTEARGYANRRGWGFDLEDVEFKARDGKGVRFLYGSKDTNTPLRHGEEMARRMPGSVLTVEQGDSHYTLSGKVFERTMRETLDAMQATSVLSLQYPNEVGVGAEGYSERQQEQGSRYVQQMLDRIKEKLDI